MPAVKIKLEGARELDRALKKLGDKVAKKIMRQALSKASTPVVKAVRENAAQIKDTGLLAKSIGRRMKTLSSKGLVYVIIGPRREVTGTDERGRKRVPANYAHLVEFGTAPHKIAGSPTLNLGLITIRGTVDHPGAAPKPFMRPAWEQHKSGYLRDVAKLAFDGIAREAKRG